MVTGSAFASVNAVRPLIDPLTPLWQGELRQNDPWANLEFGNHERLSPGDLSSPLKRETLGAQVVDFQVAHGATAVVPPYPHHRRIRPVFSCNAYVKRTSATPKMATPTMMPT